METLRTLCSANYRYNIARDNNGGKVWKTGTMRRDDKGIEQEREEAKRGPRDLLLLFI